MTENDAKGRVPYKERVVLVGPGHLRDGEHHAAHPEVMGLLLRPRDPRPVGVSVELWLRATHEHCDADGHTAFIPIEQVRTPDQLHPDARSCVDWSKV